MHTTLESDQWHLHFWRKDDVLIAMQKDLVRNFLFDLNTYAEVPHLLSWIAKLFVDQYYHDDTRGVLIGGETPHRNFPPIGEAKARTFR
jgi:hypothetical protein